MLGHSGFVAILVVVCSTLYMFGNWFLGLLFASDSMLLTIGILSSRSNFEQRQAMRQTWLNSSAHVHANVQFRFIVGDKSCQIPLYDRLDIRDCQSWNISLLDLSNKENFVIHAKPTPEQSPTSELYDIFNILILHPIVVTKIGILDVAYPVDTNCTVTLVDAVHETEVVSTKFTVDKPGVLFNGFRYVPVDPVVLPKGFEATLKIETYDANVQIAGGAESYLHTRNLFLVTQVTESLTNVVAKPSNDTIFLVSFGFLAYDLELLREHIQNRGDRLSSWNSILDTESDHLRNEMLQYQDILLVDVIDVYRNLPKKTLLFYDWVANHLFTHYVLKTDDDTFLNIDAIYQELFKLSEQGVSKLWWSRFRYNWMVDRVSKWQEHDYNAVVYPPFGCGAGNVLSADLIQWLSKNKENLHLYQGEDVSLGIWLTPLNPRYLDDSRWTCSNECHPHNFNVGEKKPDEIRKMVKDLQTCNNPCGCD